MTAETIVINDSVAFTSIFQKHLVCTFGQTSIYCAGYRGHPSLLVAKANASEAIVYKYETLQERENEMHVLRRAAQDGDDDLPPDMGVTANLPPSLPSAPVSNTHAIPVFSNREE